MNELKKKYPAFLIESHFQYEFAFVLADKYGMDVHLERYAKPTSGKNSLEEGKEKDSWCVDLEAINGNESYMFEFKYPTAKVDVKLPGRNLMLHLKNQRGGKDKKSKIWRDIEKLEGLKRSGKCTEACFVMLTNDWGTVNSRSKGANRVLDIWEGRKCPGGDFIYTKVENKQEKTHTIHITNPYHSYVACPVPLFEEISVLTGVTDETLAGAPPAEQVLKEFAVFSDGAILVGHDLPFDCKFLDYYGAKYGIAFSQDWVDMLPLAKRMLGKRVGNFKLQTIADELYSGHKDKYKKLETCMQCAEVIAESVQLLSKLQKDRCTGGGNGREKSGSQN